MKKIWIHSDPLNTMKRDLANGLIYIYFPSHYILLCTRHKHQTLRRFCYDSLSPWIQFPITLSNCTDCFEWSAINFMVITNKNIGYGFIFIMTFPNLIRSSRWSRKSVAASNSTGLNLNPVTINLLLKSIIKWKHTFVV